MERKETEIRAGGDPDRSGSGGEGTRVDTVEPVASRFDSLLRQGEALFAAELYERAIHVWTRVLFLERGNPEARQGIDRAKRALAERQRRLDATIAEARLLVDEGKLSEARGAVQSVLRVDPRHVEAGSLDSELSAIARRADPPMASTVLEPDPPAGASSKGVLLRVSRPRTPRPSSRRRASRWTMALFAAGVFLAFAASAFVLHANWERLVSGGAFTSPVTLAPAAAAAPIPVEVPSLSELFYYNGARLFEKGRYREALGELSRVERDSMVAGEARSLILRIEERLLRGASGPESDSGDANDSADGDGARP